MAADNRNFVNKFANEGGGDVLVEDKRLEELKSATAKTSAQISTTTDYIPLQDTDGNLVKINAASFQEAVRNTLGGLLANNDKGTTISGLPALSGSGAGLDFGSITPANLASVLGDGGALVYRNANTFTDAGVYNTYVAEGSAEALNFPTIYGITLVVTTNKQTNHIVQTCYCLHEKKIFNRMFYNETWSAWVRVDNFGCATPEALASLLGVNPSNFSVVYFGNTQESFKQVVQSNTGKILVGLYSPDTTHFIIGYSIWEASYGAFMKISYGSNDLNNILSPFAICYNNTWTFA